MNRHLLAAYLVLLVAALAFPVGAQEKAGADAAPSEAEKTEAEETAEEEETPEAAPEEGGEAAEEAEGSELGQEDDATAEPGEKPEGEQVVGPGGKPLRTDYPGTEESLRSRMETDQIKGLDVDPDKPAEAYQMKIKELETKVDDLKERVFQSKTRIVLLKETLLSGNLAGSQAIIIHRTEAGPAFKLRQALYSLDGTRIFSKADKDGDLADRSTFEVYNGNLAPGNHNLSVLLKYQGSGYGLFPYFEGYSWEMRQACQFEGQQGKITQVKVVTFQSGDATTSMEDRLAVRCEVQFFDNVRDEEAIAAEEEGE